MMKKALLFLLFIGVCTTSVLSQFNCTGLSTTAVSYSGTAQHFTVPVGVGQVRIRIKGGDGGSANSLASFNNAGGGATVYGYFAVVPGDAFTIIIGQKGYASLNAGGGGGASAVYKNGLLVLVAGGGGGEDNGGSGANAVTTNNGTNGLPIEITTSCDASHINNCKGGIGGNGGFGGEECSGNPNGGGGGGGFLSSGSGKVGNAEGGGQGNINGVFGGAGGSGGAFGGYGWAGGGGAANGEAGGGGGYSGGGGAGEGLVARAGGGGSFIASGVGITISGSSAGVATLTPEDGDGLICAPLLIVLPLKLHEFTAKQNNNAVLLKWKTSNEINTSYFSIERSNNNGAFSTIGNISANSNATVLSEYNFIDNSPLSLQMVYRIKMVDKDGSYSYSPSRLIKTKEQTTLSIYPNPALKKLTILLPTIWKGNSLIQIINITGKIVLQKNTVAMQNDFEVAQLPSGTYFIRAQNKQTGETYSKPFQR
jgi:hypothetical protein